MHHEGVDLIEAAGVEQQVQPLARGELAGGVLLGDPLGAPAGERGGLEGLQAVEGGTHSDSPPSTTSTAPVM